MTFVASLDRYAKGAKQDMATIARRLVLDVGTRLVMRSPVGDATAWRNPPPAGYVGGRFRANWQYGYNDAPVGELEAIDKSGAVSIARVKRGVELSPAAGMHYLANNLPYAQRLEDGYSKQAPQGMVALTLVEFSQ